MAGAAAALRVPLDVGPRVTPAGALRALRDDPMPFALTGRWAGGGAILGSCPLRVVTGAAALDAIDRPAEPVQAPAPGVVGGGWFGVLGFGLGAAIERLDPAPPRPAPLPPAALGFYDHVLRLDADGRWWLEALGEEALERRRAELVARLSGSPPSARPWRLDGMALHGAGAAGHRAAVADCVERIAAGELFQANLCLRLDGRFSGSAADAYADAAERLQPAYGAFVGLPDGAALLSFSPELFLRRAGREVETAPIKGTITRSSGDAAAAEAARAALAASAKDAAENVMIVDLMRNDLGRVAEYGSVSAAVRPDVEAHPGLWHLVGRVRATLRADVGDGELLRATFPPGSVTGAPKIQALKVISALEGTAREAYTGAIGFASPAAGLELNVVIRTLEVSGSRAWFGAGGGIVADSDPDAELREALAKARPIVEALGASVPRADPAPAAQAPAPPALPRLRRPDPAGGLLETILVLDGRPVDAERHLRRLAESAAEVLGSAPPADLAERVAAVAATAAGRGGPARLRVVLGRDGAAPAVTVEPAAPGPPTPLVLDPVLLAGGLGAHKWADRSPLAGAELVCDLDGAVLEAASANVWALAGGRLVTPPADGRILPGTTRGRLLELGAVDGLETVEAPLTLDDLARADAVIATSAIRVAAPAALRGHDPTPRAHELAAAVRAALVPQLASRTGGPVAQLVRAADS